MSIASRLYKTIHPISPKILIDVASSKIFRPYYLHHFILDSLRVILTSFQLLAIEFNFCLKWSETFCINALNLALGMNGHVSALFLTIFHGLRICSLISLMVPPAHYHSRLRAHSFAFSVYPPHEWYFDVLLLTHMEHARNNRKFTENSALIGLQWPYLSILLTSS